MQKYVVDKSLSKYSLRIGGGKSQGDDDKAAIKNGWFMKDKDIVTQ